MLKEIPTSKLRVGMYLHDIDLNLALFPAIKKQVPLSNKTIIQSIQDSSATIVVIDTSKGHDALDSSESNTGPIHKIEIKRQLDVETEQQHETTFEPSPLKEELLRVQPIRKKALAAINDAFYNAKLGRTINSPAIVDCVEQFAESVIKNPDALLLLNKIRNKNSYLYDHSINCCVLALCFGQWKKLDYASLINLGIAALLHDLGEVQLEDKIVQNRQSLTEAEHQQMQRHVEATIALLKPVKSISTECLNIIQQHHERQDGSGYPLGLSGEEISSFAQMLGMIDVYDSMTADTTYHYAKAPTAVLRQLLESDNELFDNVLIKQFIKCLGIYPTGSLVKLNNGYIGMVMEIMHNSLLPQVKILYNDKQEHFIQPIDINLADPYDNDQDLSITSCVDPKYLHINLSTII